MGGYTFGLVLGLGFAVACSGKDDAASSTAATSGSGGVTSAPAGGGDGTTAGMGGSGGSGGGGNWTDVGGGGALRPLEPRDVTNSTDCVRPTGRGGADAPSCDFVTVEFSEPLAMPNIELVVETSRGHLFTLDAPNVGPIELALTLDDSGTEALGFTLEGFTPIPSFYPSSLTAQVTHDGAVVADEQVSIEYSCVAITGDNWCWRGAPVTLPITPP